MHSGLKSIVLGLGLVAAAAALRASFADDSTAADAFDSPAVKELGQRAGELRLDDEIALVKRLQRSLDGRLLTPPAEAWKGFDELRGRTDAGLARILTRGLGEGLVTPRGGGAYWSFSKRSNSYDQSPQLELQNGTLNTGFAGHDTGFVVRLDGARLLTIHEYDIPENLRLTADEVAEKAHKPRPRQDAPKAEVGAVYAVRAMMPDECDVLAAFQVVAMDGYGATIAWRLLKVYDVPVTKR